MEGKWSNIQYIPIPSAYLSLYASSVANLQQAKSGKYKMQHEDIVSQFLHLEAW